MTSTDLLARLRGHVHDCCQSPWGCRPEVGRYCSTGRPIYDAFFAVRCAEVMAARLEVAAALVEARR